MPLIKSALALLAFFTSSNTARIPECYSKFRGDARYFYHESYRKSPWVSQSTGFYVSPKKIVYHNIADQHTVIFFNRDSQTVASINIELCNNKKFKQRRLANYKYHQEHHKNCDCLDSEGSREFQIDSTIIYGQTARDLSGSDLGNYLIFPSDKMTISIRFLNTKIPQFTSIEDFIEARNDFIHSYLSTISVCQPK